MKKHPMMLPGQRQPCHPQMGEAGESNTPGETGVGMEGGPLSTHTCRGKGCRVALFSIGKSYVEI